MSTLSLSGAGVYMPRYHAALLNLFDIFLSFSPALAFKPHTTQHTVPLLIIHPVFNVPFGLTSSAFLECEIAQLKPRRDATMEKQLFVIVVLKTSLPSLNYPLN